MIEEAQIKRLRELRENGLTIKETAKAVGISESTVKKYTSDDYERDNEIDGKTGKTLTDQMIEEEYDFADEIKPLVYSLKIQANEIDITLYDYLNDISNTMNKFLRITDTPQWFYYVFCELAKILSLINDHIDASDFMEAIDNFYNREIEMEASENFITEIEEKAERLVNNAKEEYNDWQEKINEAQKSYESITSLKSIILKKMMDDPILEKLKIAKGRLEITEKGMKKLQMTNIILIEKCKSLEQADINNEIIRQDNIMFNMVYEKLYKLFPQEIDTIIQEIENEKQ